MMSTKRVRFEEPLPLLRLVYFELLCHLVLLGLPERNRERATTANVERYVSPPGNITLTIVSYHHHDHRRLCLVLIKDITGDRVQQ